MADSPFSAGALQQQVDALLASVPEGRTVALLGVASSDGQWRVTARAVLDHGHWVVQGDLTGRGREVSGTVHVLASW